MIRSWLLAPLAVALLVGSASPAQAQFRGLRLPASLTNIFMLRSGAVQKELDINDEQEALLADLAMQLQQDAFEVISGLQDLTPEEQKEAMPEVLEMVKERGQLIQDKVDDVLDESQLARLKELSLQRRGSQALEDDEVIAALKISDAQKQKLIAIREEGNKAIEQAFQKARGSGDGQGGLRKKMAEMRNKLAEKALAVLTPEQREQFEKMKGKQFDFPPGGGFPF